MKKTIYFSIANFLFLFCSLSEAQAQNVGINGSGATAHASALLDLDDAAGGNNKGLLIPRIPLTAINAAAPVASPALSLLVYNTASASTGTNAVSPGYYYWDGAKWVRFAYNASGSFGEAWTTLGNAGTNPTTNFVGTTDAQDLVFRTNNLEAVRINTLGNVGVGTNNPLYRLHVLNNTVGTVNLRSEYSPVLTSNLAANQHGVFSVLYFNSAFNVSSSLYANVNRVQTQSASTGTIASTISSLNDVYNYGSGTVNNAIGVFGKVDNYGSGIINNAYGFSTAISSVVSGTITNGYGVYIGNIGATNKWSVYANDINSPSYFAGSVGIGTNTPSNKFEITHGTAGNSGLRLTNLPNQSFLSTNSNGDVVPLTITTTTSNGLFWGLIGNAGTNSATNFMGTIDAQDLVFKTNNTERFRILQSATPTIRANASNLLITKTGAGTNIIGFSNSNAGIVLGDNNAYGGSTTNVIIGNSNNTGGGGPINTIMLGSNFTTGGGGPSSSIFIGNNIATGGGGPLNSIFIGNGINTGGAINSVVIGNTSMTSIGGQVGWSTLSDGRFKKEVKDYTLGLEFINKLKPKSYKYNNNTNEIIYNGLIAQDVEQTLKELDAEFSGLCKPNTDSENYSIRYGDFVIPLINAVKDQQQQIEALNKKNELLLKRIEMLEKK